MNNWKDNKSDNIDNLYSTFKKFINIDNYNKHVFYNPTEFKIFILPKSEFQKYKKYSNQNEITTDQYTEQFFNGILDKIIDRLNSDSGYKLLKLGLDVFKEKSTFFLLLCRAITMQLSQMVYDGSYNEKLTSASFSSSNGSAGFNASNDGFWYTQPHDILRNIGVIGTFGQPSEFDPNDIDFEFVASREWTLEQLEALEKQVIITLTDMETQINNFQNEVNNRLNDFDTLKADKEDLAKLVLPDGTGNKTIKNVKLSGNLVSQNIIDNPDGSVSVYADFSVGGSVDEALVVDDMTTEIDDNHQSQTPSYNIFRGVNDRVSTLEEEIATKKGDTLCTWTGNLNQLSQAADMISFLENNQSKIIDIRMNTTLAFDKLFPSSHEGRVAKEEVMTGWKIRMNDNFINIICECEETFKIEDKFSKTAVRFYFTIDRGNNWCGLLVANGGNVKIVEINDGVYLPNEDLTGYKGFEASDNGQGTFNILSKADDATLNEHFLITFKYFNDTEFEVPPYEPPAPSKVKREQFLAESGSDIPYGWQIQGKLNSTPSIEDVLYPFLGWDLSTLRNDDGTHYEYDLFDVDGDILPLDSKEYGLGVKVIGIDKTSGTISSLGILNCSLQGSEDIPESWFRPFYNFSDDVDNKKNWLDNFLDATGNDSSLFLETLTYGIPDGEFAFIENERFINGVNDYFGSIDNNEVVICFPYIYWYEEETQTNKQTKEIKIDPYKNDTYEEYVIKKEKSVLEKLKELNDFLEGDK